jgi:predicted pyridoxine 5'-phosphate oxidase superfamily flavin-nucleotide-binding protein
MSVRYHEGELAVQRRAGVADDAARLGGMLAPVHFGAGAARFLAQREFAVLTARDRGGRLWTTPLTGPPGFLDAHESTVDVHSGPGGPLRDLPAGQPVGLLVIDFAIRRRFRVNGLLTAAGDGLVIDADQAYGNCPSHIHPRPVPVLSPEAPGLDLDRVDTFFLGTAHPTRGLDTSHKGGPPGFVRVVGEEVWWPDFAGNNMFNSLGNLAVNPEASLLFLDFATGATRHLSGTATVEWAPERHVRFSAV